MNARSNHRVTGNLSVEEVAIIGPEPIVGLLPEIGGGIRFKQQTRVGVVYLPRCGRIQPLQKGMKGYAVESFVNDLRRHIVRTSDRKVYP